MKKIALLKGAVCALALAAVGGCVEMDQAARDVVAAINAAAEPITGPPPADTAAAVPAPSEAAPGPIALAPSVAPTPLSEPAMTQNGPAPERSVELMALKAPETAMAPQPAVATAPPPVAQPVAAAGPAEPMKTVAAADPPPAGAQPCPAGTAGMWSGPDVIGEPVYICRKLYGAR